MLTGPRGKRFHDFTVKIDDNTISQTNSTKYLEVYIDDKLTWSDHITNLKKTISRNVGIFYRIRQCLNETALKSLYFSIVYSHLQYAVGAWSGVGKTSLRWLNILHNKIIRAMTCSSFRSKLDPLCKYLNLLEVDDIYTLEIGKIMHKIHSGNQWRSQPRNLRECQNLLGGQNVWFLANNTILFGKRLSKYKMTIFSKNLGGGVAPLAPLRCAYAGNPPDNFKQLFTWKMDITKLLEYHKE